MTDLSSSGLVPSEAEIKELIAQLMQANPMQIPNVLLRIGVAKIMLKTINKLGSDLDKTIKRLENEIDPEAKE